MKGENMLTGIEIKNHPFLGDVQLSFIETNRECFSTVLFVGENGCGKTSLLAELANYNESRYVVNRQQYCAGGNGMAFGSLFISQDRKYREAINIISKAISGEEPFRDRFGKGAAYTGDADKNLNSGTNDLPRKDRKASILTAMLAYFQDEFAAKMFVEENFNRKIRNLVARKIRLARKANLQEFNYFCTFTYDDKLHDEIAFRKKLTNCLSLFSSRKKWRYIGVWERSPEKNRLHFHGVFHIPDGTMPGELVEVNDYSFGTHQRQVTLQNTYFNKRFGRSDFEPIDEQYRKAEALAYILKYIEKTGEKVVYSKGLSQFFISDIMEDDVVCRVGVDDRKLLLFDDFGCWDEGCYVGKVSKEVIEQMRRCN